MSPRPQDSTPPPPSAAAIAKVDTANSSYSSQLPTQLSSHAASPKKERGGCHLRWSRLVKTVEVKEATTGLLSGSIAKRRKSSGGGGDFGSVAGPVAEEDHVVPEKVILNEVSGEARPGEVLALMGPSGSGKTSLLDALSGRSSYNAGSYTMDGRVVEGSTKKSLKRKIAYIKQADVFFDHLTVRDQLTYTALLRLPSTLTKDAKHAEVERILTMLRLNKCSETPIMMVSGGEKKRVNIGTELLTDPSVVMLDEPTSGLDSTSAVALLSILTDLARTHGKTVVTSIHQPSSAVFQSFDRLMLLADGCVVYFGTPVESLRYLKDVGYECPPGYNAADHWMDLLVVDSAIGDGGTLHSILAAASDLGGGGLNDDSNHPLPAIENGSSGGGDGGGGGSSSSGDEEEGEFTSETETETKEQGKRTDPPGKEGNTNARGPSPSSGLVVPTATASNGDDNGENHRHDRGEGGGADESGGAKAGLKKVLSAKKIAKRQSSFFQRRRSSGINLARAQRAKAIRGSGSKSALIGAWDNDQLARNVDDGAALDAARRVRDGSGGLGGESETDRGAGTKGRTKFNTSWATQFRVLTHRSMKNSRSAIFTPLNLVKSVALGVMTGLLWFQMPYTERTVVDRSSYFFFTMTYWVFDAMFNALFSFPAERQVIFKERASGSYHLSAYFMAKTTSEAPARLLLPSIYMVISYWMASINPGFGIFLGSTLCCLMSVLAGESMGLLVGATVMDFEKAMVVMVVFSLTLMLGGGYYVDNIPVFLLWLPYMSPFKYAYDASQQLVFDTPVPCDGSGVLEVICGADDVGVATVEQVKKFLNVNGGVGFNVGLLLVIFALPRYLAYLALRRKKGGERTG